MSNVKCECCGKIFERSASKVKWSEKVGRKILCSRTCGGKMYAKTCQRIRLEKQHPMQYLFARARSSACKKRDRFSFDITPDDLQRVWDRQGGKCAISGIELIVESQINKSVPFQASVDRIDPNMGYTANNIRIVCLIANYALHNFKDDKALISFCIATANHQSPLPS